MISADECNVLYQSRRNQFIRDLQGSPNPAIAEKLTHALLSTDLCLHTFVDFAKSLEHLTAYLKAGYASVTDYALSARRTNEELEKLSEGLHDEVLRQQQREQQSKLAAFQQNAANILLSATDLQAEALKLSVNITITGLAQLLASDNSEVVRKALWEFAKFVFGLVPIIGPIAGGIDALLDLIKHRERQLSAANTYIDRLNEYIEFCYLWCMLTETQMENYESLGATGRPLPDLSDPGVLEHARQKIEERFEGLLKPDKAT